MRIKKRNRPFSRFGYLGYETLSSPLRPIDRGALQGKIVNGKIHEIRT